MLPGMERKLTEHMMVHHYTATASEASARSLQEVPLLKGSFGHHSSSLGHGVAASSSQESLYGSQHHHQPGASGGGPPILASDSLYSLRGQHHSSQRSSALGMWNSCVLSPFITMLQKLSKCEVKAWLCWFLIILSPLRFYVKSNFGEFKNVIFANFIGSEFWF